jgi:hypothetical protein
MKTGNPPGNERGTARAAILEAKFVTPSYEEMNKLDLHVQFESQRAIFKALEKALEPGRVYLNWLCCQQIERSVAPERIEREIALTTGVKEQAEKIQQLLRDLEEVQGYLDFVPDKNRETSRFEAKFVMPSLDEVSKLDLETQFTLQASIIENLDSEIGRAICEFDELMKQGVFDEPEPRISESFVISACEEVLEQLDANDHDRRCRVKAIEQEADEMKKMQDLVRFLIEYSRSIACRREDEWVGQSVSVSDDCDRVNERVNEVEAAFVVVNRESVKGEVQGRSTGRMGKGVAVPKEDLDWSGTSELPFVNPTW